MLGVEGDVVPLVPLVVIGRVGGVAVLLLLGDERPLLIELDLAGPGGKGHQLVVGVLGVLAGEQGQPGDGVPVDPDQPAGLADAAALGEVLQDREGLLVRAAGSRTGACPCARRSGPCRRCSRAAGGVALP